MELQLSILPNPKVVWSHFTPSTRGSVLKGKLKWKEIDNCSQVFFPPCKGLNIHLYVLPQMGFACASFQRSIHAHITDLGCGHVIGFG